MKPSLENFESTFNEVAVGMAQVSLDGVFLRVNKKFCQLLGYSAAELEGRTFNSVTHSSDQQQGLDALNAIAQQKERAVSFEKRYIDKNGRILWVRVTSALVTGVDNEPRHIISVFEDVTELKHREKENSDQKVRMITASRVDGLGRMAAGMAHEINNPLTIVMGQASRLKKMAIDNKLNAATVLAMAEQIEAMSARISDIINSLRGFAREGSDEPVLPTSLREILQNALKFTQTKIILNHIQLKIDEGAEDVSIPCRGVHLTQALLNLIGNAKDAVDGKKNAIIQIKILTDSKGVGYEVHDNGSGIAAEYRSKLFQPFFTTKAIGLGTGLGLSIAKELVEKYKGELSYERSPLGGACFRIIFKPH